MFRKNFLWLILATLFLMQSLVLAQEKTEEEEEGLGAPAEVPTAEHASDSSDPALLGKALQDDIVALFVPPTRANKPIIATAKAVYQFDNEGAIWSEIYRPADAATPVLAVAGYAKSSKVLCVGHGRGIAIMRDGKDWQETIPPGWRGNEPILALAVNPKNRKEIVAVQSQRAWITADQGKIWESLPLPNEAEPIVCLRYAGQDDPVLVAATTLGLYQTSDPNRGWTGLFRSTQGPRLLATAAAAPLAYVYDGDQSLVAFDLAREGYRLTKSLGSKHAPEQLEADTDGRGLCWIAKGNEIFAVNLQAPESDTRLVFSAKEKITHLVAHPRQANSLYWSQGGRLYLMADATARLAPSLAKPVPAELFRLTGAGFAQKTKAKAPQVKSGMDEATQILQDVMKGQPPLEEVIAAALQYAHFDGKEIGRWKKNVRRRNLLPSLRLNAGTREVSVNRNEVITEVDRYGVPSQKDLRKDDDLEFGDAYSVELGWNLGNLLFDKEEVLANEEIRKHSMDRNELISQISGLYYDRIQMLLDERLNRQPLPVAVQARNKLRLEQMTQSLNQLCGKEVFQSIDR